MRAAPRTRVRRVRWACLGSIFAILTVSLFSQPASVPPPYSVLTKEGRRTLAAAPLNSQDFVALDDLASLFQLVVRDDALGISVAYKGERILLTPDQALASVSGRLVSLPAPPARVAGPARRWLVPIEFVSRALALVYDSKIDLRKPSRLIIVGDLRVPRVQARYEPVGGGRLTVDATPRTMSSVTQENDRLTIKFEADALDSGGLIVPVPPQAPIQSVRLIDQTTIGIDLTPRFAGFKATSQPIDNTMRLVLEFTPPPAAPEPNPPASSSAAPLPPAPDLSALNPPAASVRTIAIDAGHGGDDEGAKNADGVKEKDITLAVARRAKAAIEARLGIRVLLTRDDDRQVPVDERTAVANNNKADLFISLHANASFRPTLAGASVFTAAFERQAEDAARATMTPERLAAFGGGVREIEFVPWDLAQFPHLERSTQLAGILEQQLGGHVALAPKPAAAAPFLVLESANMPAVLVEMGYLTNPAEGKRLASADYQNAIVQALYDTVLRFRDLLDEGRPRLALPVPPSPAGGGTQ